jgi:regulatory protein
VLEMNNSFKKKLTPDGAFTKVKHYCAYQERSHAEVKDKLYNYGLHKVDVEILISRLIEENYLNEERFARQFAGGKFRIKKWGRVKISYELKQKRISPYNIKQALEEIDESQYQDLLRKLLADKWEKLKNEQYINRQVKTRQYLLQRGFEATLIKLAMAELKKNTTE